MINIDQFEGLKRSCHPFFRKRFRKVRFVCIRATWFKITLPLNKLLRCLRSRQSIRAKGMGFAFSQHIPNMCST